MQVREHALEELYPTCFHTLLAHGLVESFGLAVFWQSASALASYDTPGCCQAFTVTVNYMGWSRSKRGEVGKGEGHDVPRALKREAGKEMLPLVRNVPNVFMACYQIDCFLKKFLFICFCLCWVSVAVCKRSRNGEWGLLPSCAAARFGGLLRRVGLSSCGVQAQRARLLGSRARGLSSGMRASLLCGMRDLPQLGTPTVSPALAGGLSATRESLCEMIFNRMLGGKGSWPALMSDLSIRPLNSHSCKSF